MLSWLSPQSSAPNRTAATLGSAKALRALISRLSTESPQYAVETLAKELSDASAELLATPQGSHALHQLDEWAQRPLDELWKSLLADNQGQSVAEVVWSTLTQYYRKSYASYSDCLGPLNAAGPITKQERTPAILNACRAMAAFARYVLLLHMRYFSVPATSWDKLWSLIGWTERNGCATDPVDLYPGTEAKTTIRQEMLTALLIEAAPTGSLLPGQFLALDILLRQHADQCALTDRYDAQAHPFAFDPARSTPPERWLRAEKMRPRIRFFGAGGAYAELRKARDNARSSLEPPQWLARTHCSVQSYTELLERIVAEWSPEPPHRQHRREPRNDAILVAHNFRQIRCLLKFSELAISGRSVGYDTNATYGLNSTIRSLAQTVLGDSPTTRQVTPQEGLANLQAFEKMLGDDVSEPWTMNDFSASGLGATAESDCAWVSLGMLIAYRRRESVNWHLAFVRRLIRSTHGSLFIGMARIRGKVSSGALRFGVKAKDYTKSISDRSAEIEYDALRLQDAAPALLLPAGVFDLMHKYTLSCDERERVIMMKKSLDRGPNFERIEFAEVDMLRAA